MLRFLFRSREEIEMWKEKQRQVKTEEEKTKNSKSVIFDTTTANLVLRPQAPGGENVTEDESWNKHKQQISSVCYRELWTEQAEILIRQVQYYENKVEIITAAGLAQLVKRLTAEREVAGLIPGAGPILRVLKYLRNEGIPFALQAAGPSRGSDDHVKWRSRLHKKT